MASRGGLLNPIVRQVALVVSHALFAVTHTLPEKRPAVVFIDVVPCPDVIVVPPGTDQVYEVAPVTAAIENVRDSPGQYAVEALQLIAFGLGSTLLNAIQQVPDQ